MASVCRVVGSMCRNVLLHTTKANVGMAPLLHQRLMSTGLGLSFLIAYNDVVHSDRLTHWMKVKHTDDLTQHSRRISDESCCFSPVVEKEPVCDGLLFRGCQLQACHHMRGFGWIIVSVLSFNLNLYILWYLLCVPKVSLLKDSSFHAPSSRACVCVCVHACTRACVCVCVWHLQPSSKFHQFKELSFPG